MIIGSLSRWVSRLVVCGWMVGWLVGQLSLDLIKPSKERLVEFLEFNKNYLLEQDPEERSGTGH